MQGQKHRITCNTDIWETPLNKQTILMTVTGHGELYHWFEVEGNLHRKAIVKTTIIQYWHFMATTKASEISDS